ncbi:uncharacterized protein BX663DRAFT_509680 [Cokeromyces recurvatus]|uniref:uncharacterized protein n=1 Tax=Cokeromyces recurvatus TaxID=90255 RepID=UPI00221FC266|nr:uncharacterized protein BX663DRAFT_509680 [Cokeromyces recurvatus]KAI7902564.1 hypothetical protein BX663DRAFT_509680 [Cokeromyces recurvatus]
MGAKQSKSSEPIIFYNQNSNPLQFNQGFNEPVMENKKEPVVSNEKIEQLVRERVVQELQRLKEQQEQVNKRSYDELAKKNIENDHNSIAMAEDIENMIQKVQRTAPSDIPPTVSKRQEALIMCYKKNQTRPLDCWEEVEQFKEAVAAEQKKFVAAHQR